MTSVLMMLGMALTRLPTSDANADTSSGSMVGSALAIELNTVRNALMSCGICDTTALITVVRAPVIDVSSAGSAAVTLDTSPESIGEP